MVQVVLPVTKSSNEYNPASAGLFFIMKDLLNRLHNKFAFLRQRIEKKLAQDKQALRLFKTCHACNPEQIKQQSIADTRYIVLDTETTGLHAYSGDEIIEIAMIELRGLKPTGRHYHSMINPQRPIPAESTAIHHIRDADVANAPSVQEVLPEILGFIDNAVLVGHHINFDIRFINKTLQRICHGRLLNPWLDTMLLYLAFRGQMGHYALEEVAQHCHVEIRNRHSAEGDASATAEIFTYLTPRLVRINDTVGRLVTLQQ